MTLPLRTLPIVERWDCHGCGTCCRGTIVNLNPDDVARLREQRWEDHSDYRGQKIVVRHGLLRPQYTLAKRADGSCIFLTSDGLCRIHKEHGFSAKPLVCQMFPLQVVPVDRFAYVTLRRFCPSAAGAQGRPLEEHRDAARDLVERWQQASRPSPPPRVVRGHRSDWSDVLHVTDALTRLTLDGRYPLVRRLAHGLAFCSLLADCRLNRVERSELPELIGVLEKGAVREAADLFANRLPPSRRTGILFRQAVFEHLRLHPLLVTDTSWRARLRLAADAGAFYRGSGDVPYSGLPFPPTTFEALDRPLGPLPSDVAEPIDAFFEAAAASLRYALLGHSRWSIVESYRALALAHPAALWTLRFACGERPPTHDEAIRVVQMLDRAQTYAPMAGLRHRFRVAAIAVREELGRLVAWWGR